MLKMELKNERDFAEFEQNLRVLLFELKEKRTQVVKTQREMSNLMLRNHELERQLDMERRSTHALKLQLELTVKATHRNDKERENLTQRATRSEIQLSLTNQEITILRTDCQKLQLEVFNLNQKLLQQKTEMSQMIQLKATCGNLQARVKSTLDTASKETEALSAELQRLASAQQAMCKDSMNFQIALKHFACLERQQAKERQESLNKISSLKAKVDELLDCQMKTQMSSKDKEADRGIYIEYKEGMKVMEARLTSEKEKGRRLEVIISEATTTQETMKKIEKQLEEKVQTLEAQLQASQKSEAQLKEQLEKAKSKLQLVDTENSKENVNTGIQTESLNLKENCEPAKSPKNVAQIL